MGFALNGTSKRVHHAVAAQLNAVLAIPIMASLAALNILKKAGLGSNRWKVAVHMYAAQPSPLVGNARKIVITALICQVQEVAARGGR
jgi:hypothetical protein